MDSPYIKRAVCKVLNIFQHGKYLVAYVLNCIYYNGRLLFITRYEFSLLKRRMNVYKLQLSLLSPRGLEEIIKSMGVGFWSLPLCSQLAE